MDSNGLNVGKDVEQDNDDPDDEESGERKVRRVSRSQVGRRRSSTEWVHGNVIMPSNLARNLVRCEVSALCWCIIFIFFFQRGIHAALVQKIKIIFTESKIAFISYDKQLRTICRDDLQHVHGLSTQDFMKAWEEFRMGSQVVHVSHFLRTIFFCDVVFVKYASVSLCT